MIENINLNGSTVSAELHGFMYDGLYGYSGIFDYDNKVSAKITNSNTITLSGGLIVNQGRFMRINGSESISIQNGTSGVNRTDLIVSRFSTDGINETHTLAVIKGTSEAIPSYSSNLIYRGGLINEVPLFSVHLTGATIDKVEKVCNIIYPMNDNLHNNLSNANLLLNSDFVINQRNNYTYDYSSNSAYKYTLDRWKAKNLKVEKISNGVKLTAPSSSEGYFCQEFEKAIGGVCNSSAYISSVSGTVEMCVSDNNDNVTSLKILKPYNFKGPISSNIKKVYFHLSKSSTVEIKWIKLERGYVNTAYTYPNNLEEAEKCRRYYIRLEAWRSLLNYSTDAKTVWVDTQIGMRTKPTIDLKSTIVCCCFNDVSKFQWNKIPSEVNSFIDKKGCVVMQLTLDEVTNMQYGYVVFNGNVEMDAEIY